MGACDTTTLSHRVGIAVWYEQVTTPGVGQCTALGVGYVGLSKYMSDLSLLFMGACDTTWALATRHGRLRPPYRTEMGLQCNMDSVLHRVQLV